MQICKHAENFNILKIIKRSYIPKTQRNFLSFLSIGPKRFILHMGSVFAWSSVQVSVGSSVLWWCFSKSLGHLITWLFGMKWNSASKPHSSSKMRSLTVNFHWGSLEIVSYIRKPSIPFSRCPMQYSFLPHLSRSLLVVLMYVSLRSLCYSFSPPELNS